MATDGPPYPVRHCPQADIEHRSHARVFAHVGHHEGIICVARALRALPDNFVYGILLHELGHLALLHRSHSELSADKCGGALANVNIERRSWGPLLNLEYVSPGQVGRARRVVYVLTTFRRTGRAWTIKP